MTAREILDAAQEISRLQKQRNEALATLQCCLNVFEAWKRDANPHKDLKRGESSEHDAASDMFDRVQNTIFTLTLTP